jgi:transposase InsO family protein
MSPFRDRFVSYQSIPLRAIVAADKRIFYAVGTRDLKIEVPNGESPTPIILKDVLHAPDMGITIVSISRIAQAGYAVTFKGNACQIRNKSDKVIGSIPASQNGLYKVERVYAAATPEERVDVMTLHRRLAHIAPDAIRKMVKSGAIEGIQLVDEGSTLVCEACEQAKATRKQIHKEREAPLADTFGAEVHTDLWGPSPVPSLGGRGYYVTFTDDYSRFTKLTPLRSKDQTLDAYKSFAAWAQTQHGTQIKRLRSDRGGEYTGDAFSKFLKEQGTERRLTTHDTPQHNGVAESLNRRLVERMRAFLIQSGLTKSLWAEAAQFVIWIKNRTPTRVLGNTTPLERLTGQKPNLANVPEWGQRVWVHDDSGSKLDQRATMARWVGYDADSTHAHRIYWPQNHKISVERNVKFTADSTTSAKCQVA